MNEYAFDSSVQSRWSVLQCGVLNTCA